MLGSLGSEIIVVETANDSRIGASKAIKSSGDARSDLPNTNERLVDLECLSNVFGTLWSDIGVAKGLTSQTVHEEQTSAGADTSKAIVCGSVLQRGESRIGAQLLGENQDALCINCTARKVQLCESGILPI